MTRTIQTHESAQKPASSTPVDKTASNSTQQSSIQLSTDSASDNEASEKPVREKLKKTSIASIPRNKLIDSHVNALSELDRTFIQAGPAAAFEEPPVSAGEAVDKANGSRGRSFRKRSFDDLENGEDQSHKCRESSDRTLNQHSRKRSRDHRSDELFESENQTMTASEDLIQEENMRNKNMHEVKEPNDMHFMETLQNVATISDPESPDLEMRDSVLSPRKKRSRDRLDTDTDREQKIVATEEAKAQRRSEETERDSLLIRNSENTTNQSKDFARSQQPIKSEKTSKATDTDLSIISVAIYHYRNKSLLTYC